jgi:hypothetical protein
MERPVPEAPLRRFNLLIIQDMAAASSGDVSV